MRNDPESVEAAYVVEFSESQDEKKGRSHMSGYGCHLCSKKGYFPDALGDTLVEMRQERGENIHVVCPECAETYDLTVVNSR